MTKTKIDTGGSITVKIVTVHLEDLRFIEHLLRDELEGTQYKVEYNGYDYDSLDEVLNEKPTKGEIEFKTYQPYISITASRDGVRIYTGSTSLEMEGVRNKVKNYFEERRTKTQRFGDWFDTLYNYISPLVVGVPIGLYIALDFQMGLLLGLILLLVNILVFAWSVGRSSKVFYTDKVPNFFRRNQDKIMVGLIVGTIVALITVGITKLMGD